MWCAHCQADVAADVDADNRRIRCANCRLDITPPRAEPVISKTQEARELLERWSSERVADPYGPWLPKRHRTPTVDLEESISTADSAVPAATIHSGERTPPAKSSTKRFRIDAAHSGPLPSPAHKEDDLVSEAASAALRTQGVDEESAVQPTQQSVPRKEPSTPADSTETESADSSSSIVRIESAHELPKPHFTPKPQDERVTTARNLNWVSLAGQGLSYLGVLALMTGTCLVILGYFRGPASYAPTGWLITMAGQMLLFLGVITMVSSGIEQTGDTVSRKLDLLGDRILRMEQAAYELRGPKISARQFSDDPVESDPSRTIPIDAGANRKSGT